MSGCASECRKQELSHEYLYIKGLNHWVFTGMYIITWGGNTTMC